MEDIRQDSILSFDTCFCNNNIRMLKIFVPFLNSSLQKYLVIYIKYLEIQYALECFQSPALLKDSCFDVSKQKETSVTGIFDSLLPFCTTSQKEQFLQIRNLLETWQNMQGMMEMMGDMKELFPDGMSDPEAIFSMFSGMQS